MFQIINCEEINEIVAKTNSFFKDLEVKYPDLISNNVTNHEVNLILEDIQYFETFIKRTYDIEENHGSRIHKRDLSMTSVIQDNIGMFNFCIITVALKQFQRGEILGKIVYFQTTCLFAI